MAESVTIFCWCLLFLVVSTHGRIAASEVANLFKQNAEQTLPGSKPTVKVYINITELNDLQALVKAISQIEEQPLTRKHCPHRTIDVSDNEIGQDDNEPCDPVNKVDNGTALILTPFIEEGRVLEGRKASVVDPELFLGVKSYSGFFTVNKTYDSNIFFWYFPVDKKPVNETPWIVWLQGGPGASSMTGLFDEIGPFKVNDKGELERNPYSWLQNQSLVFIDNPVGSGYSFTNSKDGYVTDMATYSAHLYSALRQLLQIFPELRTAPLILAGESYAGKYVPALGMEIHHKRNSPGGDINFKGMMVGNGYMEPSMLPLVPKTFYNFGLLTQEQMDILEPLNNALKQDVEANRSYQAKAKWTQLINVLLLITHQQHAYNFLRDDMALGRYEAFLQRTPVKRALHVGDIANAYVNITVNLQLAGDFLTSTRPLFETLLNHYDVMLFCGQLDQMLSCTPAAEHYRRWQWNQSDLFRNATRLPYLYRRELAGYHKSGGRLTEVSVRGAGHMAAAEAAGALQLAAARWARAQPLPAPIFYSESAVRQFVRNATLGLLRI